MGACWVDSGVWPFSSRSHVRLGRGKCAPCLLLHINPLPCTWYHPKHGHIKAPHHRRNKTQIGVYVCETAGEVYKDLRFLFSPLQKLGGFTF